MPYPGITDPDKIKKMDSCVDKVMAQGHDKQSAIAICHESVVSGKELRILPPGVTMDEMLRIARAILDTPDVTDKAQVFPRRGGSVSVNPGGSGKQGSSEDTRQERCFLHMKKLLGDEDEARKICHDAASMGVQDFGLVGKATRLTEKASDSPGDYLIVEDREKPTTWHLQVRTNGKPDHRLMGAAWAALHGGYRGNVYEGPGKTEAIGKLRKLYASEDMPVPSEKAIGYRKCEKAITDAPNLRGEDARNCMNCKYYRLVDYPSDTTMAMETPDQEGICSKYEFLTNAEWVCDSWEEMSLPTMKTVKQADGHYRWILFSSSSYLDRDGEIVSQKALEADTERMNTTKEFGTLDWWHTPIVLGDCDFSAMHGRISIESGTFRNDWVGERFATMKGLGASRTFYNPVNEPDAQGIYHNIRTFSRAILPVERASNRLTLVDVSAKETKEVLQEKVKELIARLGGDKQAEQKVDELLKSAETTDKAAQDAGLTAKETTEAAPPEAEPKPVFVGDMTMSEFETKLTQAVEKFLTPAVKEIGEQVRKLSDAQATTQKETGDKLAASIKSTQDMQTELAARLAALEGLTPRAYRATQDPGTVVDKATAKERGPKGDAQADKTLADWLATTR